MDPINNHFCQVEPANRTSYMKQNHGNLNSSTFLVCEPSGRFLHKSNFQSSQTSGNFNRNSPFVNHHKPWMLVRAVQIKFTSNKITYLGPRSFFPLKLRRSEMRMQATQITTFWRSKFTTSSPSWDYQSFPTERHVCLSPPARQDHLT